MKILQMIALLGVLENFAFGINDNKISIYNNSMQKEFIQNEVDIQSIEILTDNYKNMFEKIKDYEGKLNYLHFVNDHLNEITVGAKIALDASLIAIASFAHSFPIILPIVKETCLHIIQDKLKKDEIAKDIIYFEDSITQLKKAYYVSIHEKIEKAFPQYPDLISGIVFHIKQTIEK